MLNLFTDVYPLATFELSLEPIFGWWVVAVLGVITLTSVWLTLNTSGISRSGRLTLVTLRLLATLVLLLGWLRPAILSEGYRETEGAIAVLMDRSASMTLPSDSVGKSRWEVQQEVWSAIVSATDLKLGGSQVIPYFYDKDLQTVSQGDLPSLSATFSALPAGRVTDLGHALAEINRTQVLPPLRAVVLIGDGTQTRTPPLSDPLLVARQMAQLDQPIYFVGIGSKGESNQLRDVALEGLPEQITAFANKRVTIPIVVNTQGMQGQNVEVTLTLKSRNQPDEVLFNRIVRPSRAAEKLAIDFPAQLKEAGDYLLIAQANAKEAKEQIVSNNQLISFVTVTDGGVRILVIEGEPRAEQQFLRLSLDRSKDFDVEYAWMQQKLERKWPIDLAKDTRLQDFEVYVIGDLDARALSDGSWSRIAARVNQGAGLLLMGGYFSYDAGGYQNSPLKNLFPIKMQANSRQLREKRVDDRFHYVGDMKLKPTRPHPITNLLPEPDNTQLWELLKPMKDGMNRFQELSANPGVQVVLTGPQGQPALVTGQFGAGRVLAFAGDSTWQWYRAGGQQQYAHQTFWRQAVLWLVNREKLSEGFQMLIDSRRQDIDAVPPIKIEWYGGSDNKPIPPTIKVALSRNGQFLKNLEVNSTGEATRQVIASGLDQPGLYRATLTGTSADGSEQTADLAFMVQDVSKELTQPIPDWRMMANIVAAGKSVGSDLFLPEETGKLVAALRERQDLAKVSTIERRRLGDAAWDTWLYFALFCGLMTFEWALRKRWQLP